VVRNSGTEPKIDSGSEPKIDSGTGFYNYYSHFFRKAATIEVKDVQLVLERSLKSILQRGFTNLTHFILCPRKAATIEVKDVQLVLERSWNMWIPGFGSEEIRPYKRSATTEAHRQRLAVIKKALKKY
jgi:transcription initiation factor TFIID subunit TAF12